MTLYLLADDIDPWTGWLEYGLLHTLWGYRTIPPVQKLSVLVPETQAPAPKGTVFSCVPESGQSGYYHQVPVVLPLWLGQEVFLSLKKRLMLSQRSLSYNL